MMANIMAVSDNMNDAEHEEYIATKKLQIKMDFVQ